MAALPRIGPPASKHLGVRRIQEFFASVNYKPSWSFPVVVEGDYYEDVSHVRVRIDATYEAVDAEDPTLKRTLTLRVPYFMDPLEIQLVNHAFVKGTLVAHLHRLVRMMEDHETDEWLRVNGVRVREPIHGGG